MRDQAVASGESVVVVEGLESIDVRVEQRERGAPAEARLDLLIDGYVPGQAREGAKRAQSARAANRRADARDQLVWIEWLGDEVIRPGLKLRDQLAFADRAEEHDRQEARLRIAAQLAADVGARHPRKHHVE